MEMSARGPIENTLYSYAWGYDSEDLELLAGCFTADAVVVVGGAIDSEGRDDIHRSFVGRRAARTEAGELPRHMTTNVLIEEEGEAAARVRSYFTLVVTKSGSVEASVQITGWYLDDFVSEDGKWLIRRREMHVDAI
jgi:ketosteroid isomerase-like protein